MPKAWKISATDCSYRAHSSGVTARPSCGSGRDGSSMMVKRNLRSRSRQDAKSQDCGELGCRDPGERRRVAERDAEAEREELRRHAELGEHTDRGHVRASPQQTLDDPVLPAVEHAVR